MSRKSSSIEMEAMIVHRQDSKSQHFLSSWSSVDSLVIPQHTLPLFLPELVSTTKQQQQQCSVGFSIIIEWRMEFDFRGVFGQKKDEERLGCWS